MAPPESREPAGRAGYSARWRVSLRPAPRPDSKDRTPTPLASSCRRCPLEAGSSPRRGVARAEPGDAARSSQAELPEGSQASRQPFSAASLSSAARGVMRSWRKGAISCSAASAGGLVSRDSLQRSWMPACLPSRGNGFGKTDLPQLNHRPDWVLRGWLGYRTLQGGPAQRQGCHQPSASNRQSRRA